MNYDTKTDILTVEELCEILRIGKNAAYKLINSGEIKCYRYNRVWKIPRVSVEEYVDKMRNSGFKRI